MPTSVSTGRLRLLDGLSALEAEIVAWDAEGRDPSKHERLQQSAWSFAETEDAAGRARLFAGFFSEGEMDGHGAEYLIDFASAAGIAEADIYAVMLSRGSTSGG